MINDLRKAQLVMQDILDYVVEICDENNIFYWLEGGTLLGAVRHKGFIPWDDDIDICMMYDDYNKFLSIFKNNEKYTLLEKNTEKDYEFPYAKVVSNLHTCEYNGTIHNKGIWIDIFPMNFYDISCVDRLNEFGILKQERKLNKQKKLKTIKEKIMITIRQRIIKSKILKLKKILSIEKNKGSKDIVQHDVNLITGKINRKYEDIFPLKKIIFEGKKYNCPNNYDNYLKELYNDYMKIPKESERISHPSGKYTFHEENLREILYK